MCRLFGLLSTKDINPYPYIFEAKYCIFKQAEIEKHDDGWGFCNIKNGKTVFIAKSVKPFRHSKEEAEAIIKSIKTNNFIFFIREASNPRNMEKGLLINIDATQPFYFNDIVFAHNGAIYIPDELYKKVEGEVPSPRSLNDSEVYFLVFLKFLKDKDDVFFALRKTERLLFKTFEETKTDKKYPFSSLNVIIAYKDRLYAYNRYLSQHKYSVKEKDREYYKMCFKFDEEKIIISSEPIDDDGWIDLGDGKFIVAWIENNKVNYKILNIGRTPKYITSL